MSTESRTSSFPAQASVSAKVLWNRTGIMLKRGIKYRFNAEGNWCDANIECDANGYAMRQKIAKYKWPLFWAAQGLRPIKTGERWFQLTGKVGNEVFEIGVNKYLFRPLSHRKSWHWESSPSLTNHRCQINPRRLLAYAAGFNHTHQNCQYSRTIFCSSAMADAS